MLGKIGVGSLLMRKEAIVKARTVPIFVRHAWKLGKGVATQFVQRDDVFFQLSHFVSEYVGR